MSRLGTTPAQDQKRAPGWGVKAFPPIGEAGGSHEADARSHDGGERDETAWID